MFVRKKPNKSGVISVQVVDKSSGKYKMVKTIGSSSNLHEINRLVQEGKEWIKQKSGFLTLDFDNERDLAEKFLNGIDKFQFQG